MKLGKCGTLGLQAGLVSIMGTPLGKFLPFGLPEQTDGSKGKMGRDVTALLERWSAGDEDAGAQAMELVYAEVREIAAREFRRERAGHTLQATAVANEALIRLMGSGGQLPAVNRAHFLAIAAKVIRRVLVDHARDRAREKRGGAELVRVDLAEDLLQTADEAGLDVVDFDRALKALAEISERSAEVVELKFIGGLTTEEIAAHLEIGKATVSREWKFARAWLHDRLSGGAPKQSTG